MNYSRIGLISKTFKEEEEERFSGDKKSNISERRDCQVEEAKKATSSRLHAIDCWKLKVERS